MNISLEARKLEIIEYLAKLEDESILLQIENLLKPKVDFWDELNASEKASIQRGVEQLDAGQHIRYNNFRLNYYR